MGLFVLHGRGVVLALVGIALSLCWRGGEAAMAWDSLPLYCAKDMSFTAIPSLADSVSSSFDGSVSIENVELVQVHALIRHGSRAPWEALNCWEGYNERWDCNVTEVTSPSLSIDDGGVAASGLFRKRYDAFPSNNELRGTCMTGQLLDEGYRQAEDNGVHLRDAYVCDGSTCLFSDDSAAHLQEAGALYLRSDDEQRTVMSGQILTASMLNVSGVVLDWHTGDDEADYLVPNEARCPRLKELSGEAYASPDWIDWLDSWETKALVEAVDTMWNGTGERDVEDCLMTSACTRRELPADMTPSLFDEIIAFETKRIVQESLYNDAAFGKLAMATLTLEIRERVVGAVNGTSPLKFVLIAGHDTTFIPFMSAVAPNAWDMVWPPYSSLLTIELLRVDGQEADAAAGDDAVGGGYFFRLVYNGQVLRLEGCDDDVCGIEAFLNATQFSVDMQGEEHCCCTNMTQAEVDASNRENGGETVAVSPAPLPVAVSPDSATAFPTHTAQGNDSTGGTLEANNRSDLLDDEAAASGGSSDGAGVSGLSVAFACFAIGALVGGIPAVMWYRSFRYEAMRGNDGNGHSYEMT